MTKINFQNSQKCIPRDWVCDNEVDCGSDPVSGRNDDSDEDPALCKSNSISCGPNQLICKVYFNCIFWFNHHLISYSRLIIFVKVKQVVLQFKLSTL